MSEVLPSGMMPIFLAQFRRSASSPLPLFPNISVSKWKETETGVVITQAGALNRN